MGTIRKWTRRAFLVTSVAVAGGVAFGVWQARRTLPNPLSGNGVMNPWLVIGADGITVVVPRAEMGQGITTTLAALVAEELDAEMDQISVIHGPPAQAYYNGALMKGVVPGPEWARSGWGEWLGEQASVVSKMLGLQVTGGSTSTADAFVKMRQAGASAREALKTAAAARLGVAADRLGTAGGFVTAPDGQRIAYADLAADAARIDPPVPPLRDPSTWRLLGRSQPRTDMVAKVAGTAQFAIDIRLPGMKFAVVRRNPGLGAGMLSHDPAPALDLPGVEKVVPLADGVAVIGNTTWAALQGADAVQVQWAPAPYPADDESQRARLVAAFDTAPNSTMRNDGAAGDVPMGVPVVEAEYSVPFLAHATMEPMSAAALFQDGALTLWAGTQAPGFAASKAADAVGIAAETVTMHTTIMGGGFGRRAETDFTTIAAQVAAAVPGTPVLVTWSREEDMTHDVYRPAAIARARGWIRDGRIGGFDLALAAPSVTQQAMGRMTGLGGGGPDRATVEGAFDQPYAIANARVRGHLADLSVPIGFWRSVGNSQNAFFHESFVDELAHAAGADPLEFRLAHIRPAHGPSADVLEAVADLSGWRAGKRPGVGRGVAFCYSFGTPVAQVVEVERRGNAIALTRAFIACDPGVALDPAIVEAQMVGGMVFGLSAAMLGEITFRDGTVQETNFPDYDSLRMTGMPDVQVRILQSGHRIGGVGEPGTPPAAPALANAIFDLTGQRIRRLPLRHDFDFVV
ncbi:MAG: molybdopterin cofactor-binding domain-containing protein [Gemmobacter sp.]|uniref:xanthine dehydrogenase family protein molybdopterin-binding subunit n=1 Tax=Gemmobacter sp. TaxID=1898957 RepID=UPI00391A3828